MTPRDSKRCHDCRELKPLDKFPRNRSRSDGRGEYCKPCHNARTRASIRRLYGDTRHYHLQQRYGIGADDLEDLITSQGGLCALCRSRPAVQVDHDHRTGAIRGALCLQCNAGLGAFGDDPAIIASAIEYLERS
jgi:hypothetical protein